MIDTSKYIGIKYTNHGRGFSGVDCWGLVWLVYKNEFGIELPLWTSEYADANKASYKELTSNREYFSLWKELPSAVYGSVGLFQIARNFHVGLCLDPRSLRILHILEGSNAAIERVDSVLWKHRIRGWYVPNRI